MTIETELDLNKVERDRWETPAMVRLDAADAETWPGWPGGWLDDWFEDWLDRLGAFGMRAS